MPIGYLIGLSLGLFFASILGKLHNLPRKGDSELLLIARTSFGAFATLIMWGSFFSLAGTAIELIVR